MDSLHFTAVFSKRSESNSLECLISCDIGSTIVNSVNTTVNESVVTVLFRIQ